MVIFALQVSGLYLLWAVLVLFGVPKGNGGVVASSPTTVLF